MSKNRTKEICSKKKNVYYLENKNNIHTFATLLRNQSDMVVVVQLVRASDCGSECRGFESHQPPPKERNQAMT